MAIRTERKRWKPGFFQLPDARYTRVQIKDNSVILDKVGSEIVVTRDFDLPFILRRKSREIIEDSMLLNGSLTNDLRRYIDDHRDEDDPIMAWIEAEDGELWDQQYGNTNYIENWSGDSFDFHHFRFSDGTTGAVIQWDGDPPEVWIGDFDRFMNDQSEPESDVDWFIHLNYEFENGLVWAFEQLGLLDTPEELPDWIIDGLKELRRRQRHEREMRTGQKYIWPDVHSLGRRR